MGRDAVWYVFLLAALGLAGCAGPVAARAVPPDPDTASRLVSETVASRPACAVMAPEPIENRDLAPPLAGIPHPLVLAIKDARPSLIVLDTSSADASLVRPLWPANAELAIPRGKSGDSRAELEGIGQIEFSMDGRALAYQVVRGPYPGNNVVEVRALTGYIGWTIRPGEGCAILGFALDPSGQRLAYAQVALRGRLKPAAWQLIVADLRTPEQSYSLTGAGETVLVPMAWPAPEMLLYRAVTPFQAGGRRGVWYGRAGDLNPAVLLREVDFVGQPSISPDGRRLAYLSSEPDRLPQMDSAGGGEPPANRVMVVDLLSGEARQVAETAGSFGDLTWSKAGPVWTKGAWVENRFDYDRIEGIDLSRVAAEQVLTVDSPDVIGSIRVCRDGSIVFAVHRAGGDALRFWRDGRTQTLTSAANAEYRVLGCIE